MKPLCNNINSPHPQDNHFLAALAPDVQYRLFQHMELTHLPLRAIIQESRRTTRYIYFPTDAIISMQYVLASGESTALSVVGNEGLLGINLIMAESCTPLQSMVQSAGYAYRVPYARVREEFDRHGQFLALMLRYTQSLIVQISQTAVCNRLHSIDQQLCRWLLLSLDRLSHNHLTMTQESISNMIGVRREGITESALNLRRQDVIHYSRGVIIVLDRQKLESLSCECYRVVKTETRRLLDYLPLCQIGNPGLIRITLSKAPKGYKIDQSTEEYLKATKALVRYVKAQDITMSSPR